MAAISLSAIEDAKRLTFAEPRCSSNRLRSRTVRVRWFYFASKPVRSPVAPEQRSSSICRDSISALIFNASIVEPSGCRFSSSSIRLLNEASSRRRRSISASGLNCSTGFQLRRARMVVPLLWSRLRERYLWQQKEPPWSQLRRAAGPLIALSAGSI
jgi:hypothetical protein